MNDISFRQEIEDESHFMMESSITELEVLKILIEEDQKSNEKADFQMCALSSNLFNG